jgi:hypothetical protein
MRRINVGKRRKGKKARVPKGGFRFGFVSLVVAFLLGYCSGSPAPKAKAATVMHEAPRPEGLIVLKPGMLVDPDTREVVSVPIKRSVPVYLER